MSRELLKLFIGLSSWQQLHKAVLLQLLPLTDKELSELPSVTDMGSAWAVL